MIVDVTDLKIYQESLNLVEKLYLLINKVSKSEYDTINQIKRSAKSIPANIAEGFGKRKSGKEFKRFLQISLGSCDETVTHLRMLYITAPYLKNEIIELAENFKILSKRINKLHSTWISD